MSYAILGFIDTHTRAITQPISVHPSHKFKTNIASFCRWFFSSALIEGKKYRQRNKYAGIDVIIPNSIVDPIANNAFNGTFRMPSVGFVDKNVDIAERIPNPKAQKSNFLVNFILTTPFFKSLTCPHNLTDHLISVNNAGINGCG